MSKDHPLVSICSITYNQEEYIVACLEGLLMQKTDFKYEIIIHDDASTDHTAAIIREYEEKYPDIIKPIYQEENKYTKGKGILAPYVYPHVKGKYIALCEGDDYWIDPYKLQKQVDFLEANPEYTLCFHSAMEKWEGSNEERVFAPIEDRAYSGVEIYDNWIIPTASTVFRTSLVQSERFKENIYNPNFIFGDIILFLTCAEFGKIYGFSDIMSVYRRHKGGVVYNFSLNRNYKQSLHDLEIAKVFGSKFKPYVEIKCFQRCFSDILYARYLAEKRLVQQNIKLVKKIYKTKYLVYVPRILLSYLKNRKSKKK